MEQSVTEMTTYRQLRDFLNCLGEKQLDDNISFEGTLEDISLVGATISDDDIVRNPDGSCVGCRCEMIKDYAVDAVERWEVIEPAGTVALVVECS